ncbi:hypothetical protein [Bifidobacterium favimelis]|uniref:Uncharacterized protein n=1 Tax=Bifidobacterium favimelis TaxID=3122979 RepID=A0ABU8ZM84_9BIFI
MTPKVNVEAIMETQRYLSDPKSKRILDWFHYTPSTPIVAVEESEKVKSVFERVSDTGSDFVLLCVLYPNRQTFTGKYPRVMVVGFKQMTERQCDKEHHNEEVMTSSKISDSDIGMLVSYLKEKSSHAVLLTEFALTGKNVASLAMASC